MEHKKITLIDVFQNVLITSIKIPGQRVTNCNKSGIMLTCLQPLTLSVLIRPRLPESCAMLVSLSFHNCPTFRVVKPLQFLASAVAVFDVKLKHPNNSTSRKLNRNN